MRKNKIAIWYAFIHKILEMTKEISYKAPNPLL